jgi:CheY-like chemotaxis protein
MNLNGKRIFVIEDDPTSLAVISTLLRRSGAVVEFDAWGYRTLERLGDQPPFDLIILDLALPRDVSGYSLYDSFRDIPEIAHVPVVIVTAADPSTEMNTAREKGLAGFISKPINYSTFTQALASVLEGKQVWGDTVVTR